MSRCYACGEKDGHLIACPLRTVPAPKKEEKINRDSFEGFEDYMIPSIPTKSQLFIAPPKPTRQVKSFLPLSLPDDKTIGSMVVHSITALPQVPCRPYHLWIDACLAGCFVIKGIFMGVSSQFIDFGDIPANMFATGRWPLPEEPDKHLEFGIDLSSWDTIPPSRAFTLQVKNIATCAMSFRACLEVWTIR